MANSDPIIPRLREAFTASGLTLDELGTKMGYEGDVARKSAWQFLKKSADPRLSMLRRFADALGIPLVKLLDEPKPRKAKPSEPPQLGAAAASQEDNHHA